MLNTVEEGLEDIRQGKVLIVVDDEDRENEGDFIVSGEKITPEIVNFMITHGRLKAVLTEHNINWDSIALHEELLAEDKKMHEN